MSPRDISSRWDNTPMRDYSTWNLKIVPFVFRVYQRVFIYIADLYTLRYLSKHRVIKIDPGDIHLKLLYLTTVFLSTMFPQGRSFFFTAEWLWVFFPSGIRAPWHFSDVDVVTSQRRNERLPTMHCDWKQYIKIFRDFIIRQRDFRGVNIMASLRVGEWFALL